MENYTQTDAAVAETEIQEAQPEVRINEHKLTQYLEKLRMEQNLPMALIGGLAMMVICALVWAGITMGIKYQIGYMAIGVGLVVGFAIRFLGNGMDKIFGILGGILALTSCMLGNFLSVVGLSAQAEGIGYIEFMGLIDYSLVPQVMIETFSPMDILFYSLATYEGYKFSFRKITEEEIYENAAEQVAPSY
jgi:hypothetical protein